jgi:hypothetical protein
VTRDFRSERMPTPEGKGIARRAWDAYALTVRAHPATQALARKIAVGPAMDLTGFWLMWHLEGGFEGLRKLGMSRASIYRRVKLFRIVTGKHPDEYTMPGVTVDVGEYAMWAGRAREVAAKSQH